jgi:hypothetical protein
MNMRPTARATFVTVLLLLAGCARTGEEILHYRLALQDKGEQIVAGKIERAELESTLGSSRDWVLIWVSRDAVARGEAASVGLSDETVQTLKTFQGNPGDASMIGYFESGRTVMMTLPPSAGVPERVHVLRGTRPMLIHATLEKSDRGVRVSAFEAR